MQQLQFYYYHLELGRKLDIVHYMPFVVGTLGLDLIKRLASGLSSCAGLRVVTRLADFQINVSL